MRFRVIILDFDGTIVESVGIKDAAFRELFKGFPEHIDEIMAYHHSHNATIRFEKFEFVYRIILNQPYSEEIKENLSERFSHLAFDKIAKCAYVPGALDFLGYFGNVVPLYLVSMSPEDELGKILKIKGLTQYFKKVYPSSWKKVDAINDILRIEDVLPHETVFVGDADEDYEAARLTDVFFIGRNSGKSFHCADIPVYKNLSDIKEFLLQDYQINGK